MSSTENIRLKLRIIDTINECLGEIDADPSLDEWVPYVDAFEAIEKLQKIYQKDLKWRERFLCEPPSKTDIPLEATQ